MAFSSTPVSLTLQQETAILASGSVVLSAGAGCGKTFVLTQRFLGYLTAGCSVDQIVAITFTERAARDMRSRIRGALLEKLNEESTVDWAGHLRDFETATITTIHSFCGDLVRKNAALLGIDPRFEILEEMLTINLMDDAIRHSLQDLILSESELGRDCRELVTIFGWSETLRGIQDLVQNRDMRSWDEWTRQGIEGIKSLWTQHHREFTRQSAFHFFSNNVSWNRFKSLVTTHRSGNAKVQLRFAELVQRVDAIAETHDLNAELGQLRELMTLRERSNLWDDEILELVKASFNQMRDDFDGKLKFPAIPEDLDKVARISIQFLKVASQATTEYQAAKQKAGVLDFDDLLVHSRDLLANHPEVLKRVRQQFTSLLLDEMQDTDPVQMSVVNMLAGDSLIESRLFAVGDVKQSIYKFRGADVELFGGLKASVPEENRLLLTSNFRSQPQILRFVNSLFESVFPGYEALSTLSAESHSGHCVEFWWNFLGDEKASAMELRKLEAQSVARRIHAMLELTKPIIKQKDGKLRPPRLGDFVLLFRSMSNVPVYEDALRQEGLDYYIVGGRAFFAQQEVYDVLNLLRALENPDDSISLVGVLRSPFAALSDDTVLALSKRKGGVWELLVHPIELDELPEEQHWRVVRIGELLSRWRSIKDRIPIASLLNRILNDSGYDAALQFESMGERKLANLWKLIELARKFDYSGLTRLADFIKHLSGMVSRELREEQAATQTETANVVRIMSVHQSKGLEFPIVVLPEMASRRSSGHRGRVFWNRELGCVVNPPSEKPPIFSEFAYSLALAHENEADLEEEARIFYVATTRAKDLLVMSGSFPEEFSNDDSVGPYALKSNHPWLEILNNRFDMRTGECLQPGSSEKLVSVHTDRIETKYRRKAPDELHGAHIIDLRRDHHEMGNEIVVNFELAFPPRSSVPELEHRTLQGFQGLSFESHRSEIIAQIKSAQREIRLVSHADGFIDDTLVVIDDEQRGKIRLGIAALAGFETGLKLMGLPSGTVTDISQDDAKDAVLRWFDQYSLEINANPDNFARGKI